MKSNSDPFFNNWALSGA